MSRLEGQSQAPLYIYPNFRMKGSASIIGNSKAKNINEKSKRMPIIKQQKGTIAITNFVLHKHSSSRSKLEELPPWNNQLTQPLSKCIQ